MVYTIDNGTYPARITVEGVPIYFIPYQYTSLLRAERWWHDNDQEDTYWTIQASWNHSIWIALAYVLGIYFIQNAMSHRDALNLKWSLFIWNATFSFFSLVGTIRTGEEMLFVLRSRSLLDSISYASDPYQPASFWALCFAISKIFELGDSVFVVLRKRNLIFLHWRVLYVAGGRWFIFMNFAVHTFMYAYYAASVAGIRMPRALSMTITLLQTLQMFIGVFISLVVFCCKLQGRVVQHSYENLYFCFAIYASFAVLFSNLFNKSYFRKAISKSE